MEGSDGVPACLLYEFGCGGWILLMVLADLSRREYHTHLAMMSSM